MPVHIDGMARRWHESHLARREAEYAFMYADFCGGRTPLGTPRKGGWIAARRRAAAGYHQEFGKEPPKGFERIRAHGLRHTFGRRLRTAGVSLEDRLDLLGHGTGRVTTHGGSAEVTDLVMAANGLTELRQPSTRTVLRLVSSGN